ncbi:hypothetical protein GCM10007301_39000 [Azorhizobium oxalatiphilum]|uniref:Helix-turn-helix domain-containing protein n=1 Tax=Azorhizobium oxalatiphilum TaxID=980631 RepID=A0A917C7U7_9HYPH|nr:helix-turn-helix domain-containing protein [Azorhizobium oxalatiphilum]GGF75313.1 hypothetical protein GCM10007301_39000 [Azorhizobium oxalatiphilum]
MSVVAMAWAWERKCGSPSAKLILMSLADFSNQDGECFPSVTLLAKLTEQSASTVRRRLQELENDGLIERREQYRENGSRTVDLIRLLMTQQGGGGGPRRQKPVDLGPVNLEGPALPECEGPPVTGEQGALSAVTRPEPSSEPSSESSPQPPGGGVDFEMEQDPEFDRFRERWGEHAKGGSWRRALSAWQMLPAADRTDAMSRLPRYLEDCRTRQRKVCHPRTYLTERRWESYAEAPVRARAPQDGITAAVHLARRAEDRTGWVFVPADSPGWQAWHQAFIHVGVPFCAARMTYVELPEGGFTQLMGRHFPSATPPAYIRVAR